MESEWRHHKTELNQLRFILFAFKLNRFISFRLNGIRSYLLYTLISICAIEQINRFWISKQKKRENCECKIVLSGLWEMNEINYEYFRILTFDWMDSHSEALISLHIHYRVSEMYECVLDIRWRRWCCCCFRVYHLNWIKKSGCNLHKCTGNFSISLY